MSSIQRTFRTEEPSLKELLDLIQKGKLQLPDFQRGWVWDDLHIRSLIASSLSHLSLFFASSVGIFPECFFE